MLLTWHNVAYYQRLMQSLRQALAEDKLQEFTTQFYADQARGDIEEL